MKEEIMEILKTIGAFIVGIIMIGIIIGGVLWWNKIIYGSATCAFAKCVIIK